MTFYAVAARFLLLTAFGFTCNPYKSLIVATEDATWRSDLPWEQLTSNISPSASLIDTTFMNYQVECFPEFVDHVMFNRTNHALIDQPSGLCLPHLFGGWETFSPRPSNNGHLSETYDQYFQDFWAIFLADARGKELPESFDPANADSFVQDPSNPSLNLPSMVLFPVVASDVVAAIQFAKEHALEISVKNSGHSFTGSSSKKNTLHLNMNRYIQYAPTSITDCDASIIDKPYFAEDLSDQPCHLSFAKHKSATIRVGGGENFDKVYRVVLAANEALDGGYKYHLYGGGAGTVSPMGWTFLGGLSGQTGARLYGLGVDQVLQIEMVLPNGYHVKFGPTKWEDASAEGFIVPRTTGVTGLCRSNPEEQGEDKWNWGNCPDDVDIDFDDLWFAVRGGGGGTWGVVTSLYLQLHDALPFTKYEFLWAASEECLAVATLANEFKATYLIAPSLLNVTKEKSHACSAMYGSTIYCYGEEDVMQAWTKFLQINNVTNLPDGACFVKDTSQKSWPWFRVRESLHFLPMPTSRNSDFNINNVLVPQSWAEESQENIKTIAIASNSPYYSFGGATATATDQANSLSQAHRNAAVMTISPSIKFFSSEPFSKMFDISDKINFPPVYGSNHAFPGNTGPRKDNWTEDCPTYWTIEQRNAGCISVQEAIYGTERLKHLEAIKEAIDPHYMFDCAFCVGNNRPKKVPTSKKSKAKNKKKVKKAKKVKKPKSKKL